jgi:hypothetical protein
VMEYPVVVKYVMAVAISGELDAWMLRWSYEVWHASVVLDTVVSWEILGVFTVVQLPQPTTVKGSISCTCKKATLTAFHVPLSTCVCFHNLKNANKDKK